MLLREQLRIGRIELQQLLNILELRLRVLDLLLTPSSAFDSLVVSPPISTVIPLILFAMRFHLLREDMKKAAPKDCSVYIQLMR